MGAHAQAYCRVLGGGAFSYERGIPVHEAKCAARTEPVCPMREGLQGESTPRQQSLYRGTSLIRKRTPPSDLSTGP